MQNLLCLQSSNRIPVSDNFLLFNQPLSYNRFQTRQNWAGQGQVLKTKGLFPPLHLRSYTAMKNDNQKLFGTLTGVFVPTLLTILGVIMYLRLGWVVGNAGIFGGVLIIMLSVGITLATGLSLSSIATNTRLEAGGPYAIISKSLGLEVGGSVGVPLYLSQALAVAMYVFGFREGWHWIFPHHPALLVDLGLFCVIFLIAYISARFAFQIQYLVMAVIAGSIIAVLGNLDVWTSTVKITWWGEFPGARESGFVGTNFWVVFAVFFPAATGIMAGANMSGELKDPRRAIPAGTLGAIALSSVIYLILAVWIAKAGSNEELLNSYTIMIDKSLYGPLVVAGLLGATFSSALSSLVGAPRILAALGRNGILTRQEWVAKTSASGEPRRAMAITGIIVLGALMLRDLNLIAPLITMFFLIAYAVINIVVLIESSLCLTSFRPTLRIPRIIPALGTIGCIFAMFIVNPTFSLMAVMVVIAIYSWILWRGVARKSDDVRSGIFISLAEWAAARVMEREMQAVRAWKPNLLVPVEDPAEVRGEFKLLLDLCLPEGNIKILSIAAEDTVADLTPRTRALSKSFQDKGVFTTWSIIDSAGYSTGIVTGLQALESAFFRPNIIFLRLPEPTGDYERLKEVIRESDRLGLGIMLLGMHPKAGLGRTQVINLWIPPFDTASPLADSLNLHNMNLAVLTAYRLTKAWKGTLNLITVVEDGSKKSAAARTIEEMRELTRIPKSASILIMVGDWESRLHEAPQSDMDILPLRPEDDLDYVKRMVDITRSSCLFVKDSGRESAVA